MPKESLKDKLDGNELDLSLNDLSIVPVKELAALPKATHIDMSCNLLVTLPLDFCNLNHIVKLDLSKNKLTVLPDKFGNLSRLQHLDLLGNQLTTLPVGMSKLNNLRWLDVKDNPLSEKLSKVAGDCLDDVQCRQCAKNIVAHLKMVSSDQEREKQRQIKQKKALEEQKKKEEEKEKQKQKAERKAERERRKREYEAAQAGKHKQEAVKKEKLKNNNDSTANGHSTPETSRKDSGGISCCGLLLAFLVVAISVIVGFYFFCEHNGKIPVCRQSKELMLKYYNLVSKNLDQHLKMPKF